MRAGLLFALTLSLAACPPAPGGAGEGEGEGEGENEEVDLGCSADEECDGATICDLATGDCVPGLDCTQNEALCGFCGDPAADCGFGVAPAYCSDAAGVCRRQKGACGPCAADEECAESAAGLPSVCNNGFCAPGCGGCPAGFRCEGGGCVPFGGVAQCDGAILCSGGVACPDGQTCTDLDVCLELCFRDADCGAGEICDLDVGSPREQQCVPGCPLGERVIQDGVEKVCHADGRFGDPCPTEGATAGCPTGTECDADGVCQRAGCQDDTECPLIRTFCDVATATCVDGCNSVDDCGAFEQCDTTQLPGTCRPEGCRGKELSCELGQWCCGAERFEDASLCPDGVEDGFCFLTPDPWCRTCEDNDDCADINENGFPSFCYEMQDAQGNPLGKFCSVGCNSNVDCPRGIDCVQGLPTDQEGVTTNGCLDSLCPSIAAAR